MAAVFFTVFFHHKLTAPGAILVYWFKVANKIAIRVFCATIKFLSPSFGFSRNNFAVTFGALCKRNGPGIPAFRKTGTREEKTIAAKLLYYWFTAFLAHIFRGLIQRSFE
jgi:hypothetical protein